MIWRASYWNARLPIVVRIYSKIETHFWRNANNHFWAGRHYF